MLLPLIAAGAVKSPGAAPVTTLALAFDVDNFATVHDGSTDDIAHFNSAFSACTAAGGGLILVGPYRYYLSTTPIVPNGCFLSGGAGLLPVSAFTPNFFQTQPYTLLVGGNGPQLGSGSAPDATSGIAGLNIVLAGLTPATDMQSALTEVTAFSNTGITIPHTSGDSIVENIVIAGFNLCIDSETFRAHIRNVLGDCTNGMLVNNATDVDDVENVHWQPILTNGISGADSQYSITAVANSSGLAQITVSSITTDLANGNTVWLTGLGGRTDLNGKWTIGNLSVGASTTTFTATGSSFGGSTVTGNTTGGSPYITGLSATSQLGYFGGQAVSDSASGNCIPGGTTILWVNPDTDEMQLSANASCSQSSDSIVVTAQTYTSGGTVDFNVLFRSGYGTKVTNSQQQFFSHIFDFGHQTCIDVGIASIWAQFVNYGCDGSSSALDPTRIGVLIESTASQAKFTNGSIIDAGIAVEENTSGALSGTTFPSVMDDTTIYANKYLGAEVLSGAIEFGSGTYFRSTGANFFGDSAVVTNHANYLNTGGVQYQSASDSANLTIPLLGNLSLTGNANISGVVAGTTAGSVVNFGDDSTHNGICLQPATTGSNPQLYGCGVDTNRGISFYAAGNSAVNLGNKTNGISAQIGNCPSGTCANYISLNGNASTHDTAINAAGSDTNINLDIAAKGTGAVKFSGVTNLNGVSGGGTASKYVCVDSSGNIVVQSSAC